jgi:hypothetical protein
MGAIWVTKKLGNRLNKNLREFKPYTVTVDFIPKKKNEPKIQFSVGANSCSSTSENW